MQINYGSYATMLACLDSVGKNRGKNAEKPDVFNAKKRENRTKIVNFFGPDAKVRVYTVQHDFVLPHC
jgi:hypothetical protein